MGAPAIELVCFDLGNVLVRLTGGLAAASARAGIALPRGLDPRTAEQDLGPLIAQLECGRLDQGAYFRLAAQRLAALDIQSVIAIYDAWIDGMVPGATRLLQRLAGDGVRTACLSNTSPRHWQTFRDPAGPYAPLALLDRHFASHLVGALKPEPAIYRDVARHTGVEPGRILFFDDHPPNVDGARAQGWQAERIDPGADPAEQLRAHLERYRVLRPGSPATRQGAS